jgi:hypothetical protein
MIGIDPLPLAALTGTILGEIHGLTASQHATWLRALPSLQSYVFRPGLLEDGDVGVGVFPEGKEVLVGGARFL